MKSKKGVSLSLNAIIIAALVLFVLIVLIIIFKVQITDITKGFTGISKDAQSKADESKGGLSDIFGGCEENTYRCNLNTRMVCKDSSWKEDTNCAENNQICEGGQCVSKDG